MVSVVVSNVVISNDVVAASIVISVFVVVDNAVVIVSYAAIVKSVVACNINTATPIIFIITLLLILFIYYKRAIPATMGHDAEVPLK